MRYTVEIIKGVFWIKDLQTGALVTFWNTWKEANDDANERNRRNG